jgi:hypothetical protein
LSLRNRRGFPPAATATLQDLQYADVDGRH